MSGVFMGCGAQASTDAISPITASAWDDPTGATPQATADRALTVPAGNPGNVRLQINSQSGGILTYRKNAGAYTAFTSNDVINFADTDTLGFRLQGASQNASIGVYDATTGDAIDATIVITTT